MAWRLARSLDVLTGEIRSRWPGTTVWTIGDQAHRATWSDHNPNAAGVVCAVDVLGNGGMGLGWFAARVVATDPPALKYVIYNRRIWLPGYGWNPYNGSNPHATHVHVSVGWGADGRSTGPYDDRSPWGIKEDDDMEPRDVWLGVPADVIELWGDRKTARNPTAQPGWVLSRVGQWTEATRADVTALRTAVAGLRVAVDELRDRPAAGQPEPLDYDRLADALLRKIAAGPTP